ncbi:Rhs family protein [Anoxybacillus flavithermus NBRC 109594]|uniref:Rhs family protein n=1 Tax=Anoxybacillus flavithermus NBRC 109594 TaxID=1315967 RepID=R4G1H4_9BACL|nr:Rhs family protein [Anoxybacillus flavithermus NBRC 109594]
MADENPYRYAGYQYNQETGLYYLIARYYHPTHGVFLSLDPDPGDADDILTQNGYTYANNNPVMLVDPDGHFVWMAINAGFAAYDGYKAFKKGGWKAAAIAVGVGLVGGAAFKAFRAAQVAKGPARYWYKGTFKNGIESLAYHHNKHVIRKGRSYSPERYTKLARAFYRSNKHLREEVTLSTGKKGYRIKKGKVGGYYTKRGKIVTFWHNGWKLKK